MADSCRSCHAPIEWVQTENGRAMPIDPQPRDDGNLVKIGRTRRVHAGRHQIVSVVSYIGRGDPTPAARFVSHFATCPNRDRHRKRSNA